MTKASLQWIGTIRLELPLHASILWRKDSGTGGRFLPIPSLLLPPNKIVLVPSFLERHEPMSFIKIFVIF